MTALKVLLSADGSLVGGVEEVDAKMYHYIVPSASKKQ